MRTKTGFEWDSAKDKQNQEKQGVSFQLAQHTFLDSNRIVLEDFSHSQSEKGIIVLEK